MDIVEKLILDDSQFQSAAQKAIDTLKIMGKASNETNAAIPKLSDTFKKTTEDIAKNTQVVTTSVQSTLSNMLKSRTTLNEWGSSYKDKMKMVLQWEKDIKKAFDEERSSLEKNGATAEEVANMVQAQSKVWDDWREAYDEATKSAGKALLANVGGAVQKTTDAVKSGAGTIGKSFKDAISSVSPVTDTLIDKLNEIEIAGIKVGDITGALGKITNGIISSFTGLFASQTAATAATTANTAATAANTSANAANGAVIARTNIATRALAVGKALLAGAMKLVTGGFNIASGAAKLFSRALISTGIGALVIALGSLYAYFTKSQEGADKMSTAGAYLKGIFMALTEAIKPIGKFLSEAFENPKQAISDLWEFLKTNLLNRVMAIPLFFEAIGKAISAGFDLDTEGVKKAMGDVATAAIQFGTGLDELQQNKVGEFLSETAKKAKETADAMSALEKRKIENEKATTALLVAEANLKVSLAKNKKDAEDITKSYTQRIIAAKAALGAELQILTGRKAIASENLAIAKAEAALQENTREQQQKIGELQAELANISSESLEKQIELQNKLNGLYKEAEDKFKEISGSLITELKEIGKLSREQEFDLVKEEKLKMLLNYRKNLEDIIALNQMQVKEAKSDAERVEINKRIEKMNQYVQANEKLIETWQNKKFIRDWLEDMETLNERLEKRFKDQIDGVERQILTLQQKELYFGVSYNADIEKLEKEKKKIEKNLKSSRIEIGILTGQIKFEDVQKDSLRKILIPDDEVIEKSRSIIQKQTNFILKNIDDELNATETKHDRIKELEKQRLETVLNGLIAERAAFKLKQNEETAELDRQIENVKKQMANLDDDFTLPFQNAEEMWKYLLEEMFGEGAMKKIVKFTAGAAIAFNEFNSLIAESQQLQIENIDKQLEKLSEKREDLESALDYELELREQGLANNVGDKQKEVDAILAEEERLQKEKEALQEEAQRRQFLLDTANQAQSLITSSIKIFEGFQALPFGLGIPLGIAAVASLFTLFAKVKIDAYKATKLYTGADSIQDHFGFGQRYGETDLEGRGSGYRLVDERSGKPTNVIISGKEMLVPEKYSLEHELFFQKMKVGAFNGLDLNSAIGFYMNFKDANRHPVKNVINVHERKLVEKPLRQWVPFVTKDGKSGAILKTIAENEKDNSIIHFNI